jgi:ABC-type dipeptide/oligopeptide/nickel transport system ATPase subunit
VIDSNYSDKGEKKFETGKLTSKQIDPLLRQGKTTPLITRSGAGKETTYYIAAAD